MLGTMLWKNYLLKRANPFSTLSEILIPLLFMCLLIWIKTLSTAYDSPNVAYYCGQASPWFYSQSISPQSLTPYQCLIEPPQCGQENYYQEGFTVPPLTNFTVPEGTKVYEQYGYVTSGLSSGTTNNPFYTYTVADPSQVYQETQMDNPSLPMSSILSRMSRNHALLALAPLNSDPELTAMVLDLSAYIASLATNKNNTRCIYVFDDQDSLDSYITNDNYNEAGYGHGKVGLAIVLNSFDIEKAQWDYSVRSNFTQIGGKSPSCLYGGCDGTYNIPSTKYYTDDYSKPQSAGYMYGYTYSGFSTLQQTMDQFIFSHYTSNKTAPVIHASVSMMPTVSYITDNFESVISSTLPLFYMLSFTYPVSRIIRALVMEKESRIKEGMKMMGLTDFSYNMSWFITIFAQLTTMVILITLVTSTTVFEYSNKVLVFIFLESYSLAIMSMCFLFASVFSKARTAALLGTIIFFISYFPSAVVSNTQYSPTTKAFSCLLAPTCFSLGTGVFALYEGGLVGVQGSNIASTSSLNFSYSLCVGMLIFDFFLYGFLAWYLDLVLPSEYGTALPYYFFLTPSYWRSCFSPCLGHEYKPVPTDEHSLEKPLMDEEDLTLQEGFNVDGTIEEAGHTGDGSIKVEPVPPELRKQLQDGRAVRIRGLRKVYTSQSSSSEIVAVKGLNLDMFEGQVSVLLGHNGAGKSTTISMLVGLTPPSAGTAYMCGNMSITNDLGTIRKNLGVCPQHDILFPDLTVMQHLELYASFKGVKSSDIKNQAMRMISEVGLLEKAQARSSTLSGGQKRKLSVGIALIGDSKVVILDEPTSGMDPYSRRSTWNIIQKSKKDRVILLTTHFMDEADILGDRIAIMADGKLQCVGASYFLKVAYGVGYTLTVIKKIPDKEAEEEKDASRAFTNQTEQVKHVVSSLVPSAEPLSTVGAEQSFRVPFSASTSFPDLFNKFDSEKAVLGISEYGISVTTLEEVFMRVGRMSGHDDAVQEAEIIDESDPQAPMVSEKAIPLDEHNEADDTDFNVFTQHFKALLIKRVIYGRRDTRMFICQLLIPVLIVCLGLALLLLEPSWTQPDYVLSSQQYNTDLPASERNYVPLYVAPSTGSVSGGIASQIYSAFNNDQVQGLAVPITPDYEVLSPTDPAGTFSGCSVGAYPLYNMSDFLIQTVNNDNENGASRYGSVTIANSSTESLLEYNLMVNGSAMHGVGVYMNEVHQAFLQALTKNSLAQIVTHNFPLPETFTEEQLHTGGNGFVAATFIMIAYCFVPGSFASFVVKEREVHAKHQQIISGVGLTAYWLSTLVWDYLSYIPTAVFTIAAIYAFQVDSYTTAPASNAVLAVLFLFGLAAASFTYFLSYAFNSHTSAQTLIMFFNFVTGLCFMIVSFVLTVIPSTAEMNLSLRYFFRLFPAFCLGDSLLQLALCLGSSDSGGCPTIDASGYNYITQQGPFAWQIAGANLLFLACEAVIYFFFTLGVEYSLTFPSLLACFSTYGLSAEDKRAEVSPNEEDEDVWKERNRVLGGSANDEIVLIKELRKVYVGFTERLYHVLASYFDSICGTSGSRVLKKKVAVNSLCFGVPKGQCFGFLGINGAGKTTTLSILSGEFPPTSGTAFIDGCEISDDQSKIRRKIGYCPQFDALLELLTVREHIELYGRIKGKNGAVLKQIVDGKLDQLDLRPFENKTAGSLSGGNKRKLSVAVATVCEPSIVFLDEPSTGMDPVARRFMWKVISRMSTQDGRCSIILTTHSMEEAEALCTRIGVMVNGRLQCLGSPQHLKLRFGDGFEVNVKTELPSEDLIVSCTCTLISKNALATVRLSPDQLVGSSEMATHILTEYMSVPQACSLLSKLDLIEKKTSYSDASSLPMQLQLAVNDRGILVRNVIEWIIPENHAAELEKFLQELSLVSAGDSDAATSASGQEQPGAQLLERSSAHTFKYRLRVKGKPSLATLFRKFEAEKARLHVQEYSIGQTTLEQIFNHFAASQDNPEVAAVAPQRSTVPKLEVVNPIIADLK